MKDKQARATIPAQTKKNSSKEMAAAAPKPMKKGGTSKMSGKNTKKG